MPTNIAASLAAEKSGGPRLVQGWAGKEVAELSQAPQLKDIYRRWTELSKDRLPRLNEMISSEQYPMLDSAALMLRLPSDFLFVHHGDAAVQMMGRDFTGVLHSEVAGTVAREMEPHYIRCVERLQPIYVRYVSEHSARHFGFEAIAVPLAADNSRKPAFILMRAVPMDDKLEVLRAVFERSPIGMIAALPFYQADGKSQDGRVMLINKQARDMLRIPDTGDPIKNVRDLGPWLRDNARWTRKETAQNAGRMPEGRYTLLIYHDELRKREYRVTIESLERFMLFSLSEV